MIAIVLRTVAVVIVATLGGTAARSQSVTTLSCPAENYLINYPESPVEKCGPTPEMCQGNSCEAQLAVIRHHQQCRIEFWKRKKEVNDHNAAVRRCQNRRGVDNSRRTNTPAQTSAPQNSLRDQRATPISPEQNKSPVSNKSLDLQNRLQKTKQQAPESAVERDKRLKQIQADHEHSMAQSKKRGEELDEERRKIDHDAEVNRIRREQLRREIDRRQCFGSIVNARQGFDECLRGCLAYYSNSKCRAQCYDDGLSESQGRSCFTPP